MTSGAQPDLTAVMHVLLARAGGGELFDGGGGGSGSNGGSGGFGGSGGGLFLFGGGGGAIGLIVLVFVFTLAFRTMTRGGRRGPWSGGGPWRGGPWGGGPWGGGGGPWAGRRRGHGPQVTRVHQALAATLTVARMAGR